MSMVKEMTSGKPYSLILGFAIPMIFGNIFQQLYNMVDTIIVGKYVGVDALAGVGSTGAINFLVIGFALGICSGFSIKVAQSFGAGDCSKMRRYIINAAYLCAVVAIILTTATMLLTGPILRVTNTPEEIFQYAYDYIIIIFAGISATMFYNMLAGILRALGDSKSPLIFLGISSVLNIALDLFFIIVFDMGVKGAGLATVISQGVSACLCFVYMCRSFPILQFEKGELSFELYKAKRLISVGIPMALQFSITAIGSIIVQTAVNSLGTAAVASVTAASKIQAIAIACMESLGITMATYCGQNRGARKFSRIRTGIRQSIAMSMIYCVFAFVILSLFSGSIALLFVDPEETEILKLTTHYLKMNGFFYPTLGVLFILRNSLQGLGYSFLPMMAGVSELAARIIVVFGFVTHFGFNAACLASPIAWCFADVLLITAYFIKIKNLKYELLFKKRKLKEAVR